MNTCAYTQHVAEALVAGRKVEPEKKDSVSRTPAQLRVLSTVRLMLLSLYTH
jgi:hypothetical protein